MSTSVQRVNCTVIFPKSTLVTVSPRCQRIFQQLIHTSGQIHIICRLVTKEVLCVCLVWINTLKYSRHYTHLLELLKKYSCCPTVYYYLYFRTLHVATLILLKTNSCTFL